MTTETTIEPTLSGIRIERKRAKEAAAEAHRLEMKRSRLATIADFDAQVTSGIARLEELKAAKEKLDKIAGNADLTIEELDAVLRGICSRRSPQRGSHQHLSSADAARLRSRVLISLAGTSDVGQRGGYRRPR